jgi:hypothetical protein
MFCAQSRIEKLMVDLSFVSFDMDKVMMEVDPLLVGDYLLSDRILALPRRPNHSRTFNMEREVHHYLEQF